MKRAIEDEEYVKWMFMLGKYHGGQRMNDYIVFATNGIPDEDKSRG